MDEDSRDLLEKARNGDMDAFALLFELLRVDVFRIACRYVGPGDAEDVTMDTFLKAWRAIPRFSGRSSLKTWLYRITCNSAIDFIRKRRRLKEVPVSDDGSDRDVMQPGVDAEPGPDELVMAGELAGRVRRALDMISEEHRTALLMRYADGMQYAEIASATGVSIGTVMSRLFNARHKLRTAIEQLEELAGADREL